MSLEMQQQMVVAHKMGDDDQDNAEQPRTAIRIDLDDESSGRENLSPKLAPRAVFFVLLFNLFLIVAVIPVFLYFRSENELLKKRILDFLIVGGAIIGIPVLYSMGDLSKDRPNFYYI